MITFTIAITHGASTPAYAVDGPASTVAITRSVPMPQLADSVTRAVYESLSRLAEINSRCPRPAVSVVQVDPPASRSSKAKSSKTKTPKRKPKK